MSKASANRGPLRRVFISEPIDTGWIIEKLMRDLAAELNRRDIETQVGLPESYSGQELVFHSRFLYAARINEARLNSLFITHIDDGLKEAELRRRIGQFDSFVCISPAEAAFVCGFGCPVEKTIGLALPHRGGIVQRPKVALFSARYNDGRKNEAWLLEYFEERAAEVRNGFIICFIGHNWEGFCARMASRGLSFELYRYDRELPGEYEIQKALLQQMDYLIYPGFDGGAMCVYDAIFAGARLVISDNGYHRDLGVEPKLFRTREEFFAQLDLIVSETFAREKAAAARTVGAYAEHLLAHWNSILLPNADKDNSASVANRMPTLTEQAAELQFYRSHYKPMSFRRAASSLYREVRRFLSRFRNH